MVGLVVLDPVYSGSHLNGAGFSLWRHNFAQQEFVHCINERLKILFPRRNWMTMFPFNTKIWDVLDVFQCAFTVKKKHALAGREKQDDVTLSASVPIAWSPSLGNYLS